MEVNGNQPANGQGNSAQTDTAKQTALGRMFNSMLTKIMDAARENSNSGA